MARQVNVRADKDHRDALEGMVDRGEADSMAEAMRQTSQANLAKRGYLNSRANGIVAAAFNTVGTVMGIIGIAWFAVSFYYPVEVRIPAMFFLSAGVVCFGIQRAVEQYEPASIERLFRWGRKA